MPRTKAIGRIAASTGKGGRRPGGDPQVSGREHPLDPEGVPAVVAAVIIPLIKIAVESANKRYRRVKKAA